MTVCKWRPAAVAALTAAMLAIVGLRPSTAIAQSSSKGITLYEDVKTGALYRKPGRGRVAVVLGIDEPASPAASQEQVHREVQQSSDQLRAEFLADQEALEKENAELQQKVGLIEPAWRHYVENFQNKFRVGALVYADYGLYTHTGFGPQSQENLQVPGPGNNIYNSFDITRAYLNFYFFPTPDWQLRVTPDIYKSFGSPTAATIGKNSAVGSNLTGGLDYQIKYAYLEYNKILDWAGDMTKGSTIAIGALPNPFIPWSEDLWGFRYVTRGPWNYCGLSSGQFGIKLEGPLQYNELTYVDYSIGAFSNAKFSQYEQTNTKQFMGRVSLYPFGAKWRFQRLGLTGFYDYGYGNSPPDTGSSNSGFGPNPSAFGHVNNSRLTRLAALIHYDAENWSVGGEFDWGHNAFNGATLFSSTGPAPFFTPPVTSTSSSANPYTVPYYNFSAMTAALLNNSRTEQQGFDAFGRLHLPQTRFTLFGLFQWFQPNTKVSLNPLDFQRYVVGVQYQVNEFVRLSLDTQNLMFYRDQTPFSTAEANSFGHVFVPITNTGKTGPKTFTAPTVVTDPVPRDTHAMMLNLEFNF